METWRLKKLIQMNFLRKISKSSLCLKGIIMKNPLFFFALLFLVFSNELFAQNYMELSKKELQIEYQKKLSLIDRINQELQSSTKQNEKLQFDLNSLIEKHSVSFDTPEDYAKSILKLLRDKKKDDARKLLLRLDKPGGISNKLNEAIIEEAKEDSLSVSDWIEKINLESLNSFDKVYYDGINLGIDWRNVVFQNTEFKIAFDDNIDTYGLKNFKVFFKAINKVFYFRISEALIINDKPFNWRLSGPYDFQAENLEKEKIKKEAEENERQRKIELENKPYTPWGLSVGKADWNYYLESKKTFTSFRVKVTNNTAYRVDRVKFQVIIYIGGIDSNYKYFAKTYDQRIVVEPGDVITIDIPDLSDFYLGEDISNQDNWWIDCKVLEVYPKR